jgi:hypothetical protein
MSEAGGSLTILAQAYVGYVGVWDQLDPVQRNLRRVSHGAAYLAAVAAFYSGHWPALAAAGTLFDYLPNGDLWREGTTA